LHVLVTGAGGFLGRYIAEQSLARGDRVRGLARGEYPQLADQGVEMICGDLRDAETVNQACHGVDVVYHVAAIAGIWGPWQTFYDINTLGTRHVIAACRKHQVGRLVFTSSPSVTFDGHDQNGVDESAPYPRRWLCHYPHTKALAEQEVLAADQPGELLTCALRPHLIWGPRDEHLIPRLIEPSSGELLIDGVPVQDLDLTLLRSVIGVVPQESFLFSDTIYENIAMGTDNATEADVNSATDISQLSNDLSDFHHGFDTMMGERGVTLSGGQKQRTALARAVIRNPQILILDDAMASVDTHTEDEILDRLRKVMVERTTIIIAHRISTVKDADHIIVLDDGQIVEQGTHSQLITLGGIYFDMFRQQQMKDELSDM